MGTITTSTATTATIPLGSGLDTAVIAARYQDLAARRDALDAEMTALKNRLRAALGDIYADEHVTIRPNKRFSSIRASEFVEANPAWAGLITETVVSGTLARKNLPPTIYEDLMVPVGDPVVRFK